MKPNRLTRMVVALAWLVSLGLFLCFGVLLGTALDRSSGKASQAEHSTRPDAELSALFARYTGSPLPKDSETRGLNADWKLAWQNLLRTDSAHERAYVANRFVSVLSLSQIAETAAYITSLPRTRPQEETLAAVCRRWAELDGRSALAFAVDTEDVGHEVLLRAALSGWAKRDAKAAWQWVLDRPVGRSTESARYGAIVRTVAVKDADFAFGLANSLPFANLREDALRAFAEQQLETSSPRRVISYWQELPDGALRNSLYEFTAESWARYDPVQASTWATNELEQPLRHSALIAVAQSWAQTNPRDAIKWALGVNPDYQADVIEATTNVWLEQEGPAPLAKWLNAETRTLVHEPVIKALAYDLADTNPTAALTWAHALLDPVSRDSALIAIYQLWLQRQPDAALAALYEDTSAPAALRAEVGIGAPTTPAPDTSAPFQDEYQDIPGQAVNDIDADPEGSN